MPRTADVSQVKRFFSYQSGGHLPSTVQQLYTESGDRMVELASDGAPILVSAYGVGDGSTVVLRVSVRVFWIMEGGG